MASEHPAELASRAAAQHVVVIGAGVSGLIAARECARVGMRVTVLEADETPGGCLRSVTLRDVTEGDVTVDAGADGFATRGGHMRTLLGELGLDDAIVAPDDETLWLSGIPDAPDAPFPTGTLLGIPANPFQEDVRAVIGWGGVWRAYIDRLRPPLTIGHERNLGRLVRSRMGERVHDRLVAPLAVGVYGVPPEQVDVDVAAPGLNAALTRVGSLSGAVMTLLGERAETAGKAEQAALGVKGGMGRMIDALVADLQRYGVEVRTGTRATGLERRGSSWTVHHDSPAHHDGPSEAADDTGTGAAASLDAIAAIDATAVIVAAEERAARELLEPHVAGLPGSQDVRELDTFTLLLDAPELDAAPRGAGVLPLPGTGRAERLMHLTAQWGWLRHAAQGRHVVRVCMRRDERAPESAEAAARTALSEASRLLGVPLRAEQLLASERQTFVYAQPSSTLGAAERTAHARRAVRGVPGLAAVGAWLSGSGLAQVLPDAVAEADRLRTALLWE